MRVFSGRPHGDSSSDDDGLDGGRLDDSVCAPSSDCLSSLENQDGMVYSPP